MRGWWCLVLLVACDGDGDGVAGGADCDDRDPRVWESCATCTDADADGFIGGCDAYPDQGIGDCDDHDPLAWPYDDDGDEVLDGCGWRDVGLGVSHACGIASDRTLVCTGADALGQLEAPAGEFVRVAAGLDFSCALDATGAVTCWGSGGVVPATPSDTDFVQIETGSFACGLKEDDTVRCWGGARAPEGWFADVSVSLDGFACGIDDDTGGVLCWGADAGEVTNPPEQVLEALSVGTSHACGLNPRARCWGADGVGQASVPDAVRDTAFASISAGHDHTCAVEEAGPVRCWGGDAEGQATPPAGAFRQVEAGWLATAGITAEGALVWWGDVEALSAR